MALSRIQYTGTGSTDLYSVPFPYISKAYVEVRVGGTLLVEGTGYVWQSTSSIRLLAGNLGSGVVLDIRRNTPKTAKLVDFQDGSLVTEAALDLANDQTMQLVQEAADDMADRLALDSTGVFDATSKRIKNVADPTSGQDAVTKAYGDVNYGGSAATSASASAAAAASSASSASASASAALTSEGLAAGYAAQMAAGTIAGNLSLTGTGARIRGDFSNATAANRVMFQDSGTNKSTLISAIPSGTSTTSGYYAHNASDPTNASFAFLGAFSGEVRLYSDKLGTGTYLPMTFYTGGAESLRLHTDGQITGGNSAGSIALGLTSTAAAVNARIHLTTTSNSSSVSYVLGNSHASINKQATVYLVSADGGLQFQVNQTSGAEPTTGTSSLYLAGDGAIYQKAPTGLGYGVGAGGTVTQATSKSTAVTLNKPTGQITMHNVALAAGASVSFSLSNSIIAGGDAIVVNVYAAGLADSANYSVRAAVNASGGGAKITLKNESGGSLSEGVVLNFDIFKGATT